jgi:predicted RNase H-like HicB family nuclease/uncharacterized damage-inducible protein DinB
LIHHLAIEDIEVGHWIAWVLDLPACFSSGRTNDEAIRRAPQRISAYYAWVREHDGSLPVESGPFDIEVVETFHSRPCREDPDYLVNAFFEDDRRPLSYWEVNSTLRLLGWTRQDLVDALHPATKEQLEASISGEVRGSILGIVDHVASAENWYFQQLDVGTEGVDLPVDPAERLETVRANTLSQLPRLIGREEVTENCDEFWSPRKVIRRVLWHERDHTSHIEKLLSQVR